MCTINPCKYCVEILSLLPELKYTDTILLNLGKHYQYIPNNYDNTLMIKYYSMASEKGNLDTMKHLGLYYGMLGKYKLMIKYFLMAIEKGDADAMNYLGYHYDSSHSNYYYKLMIKYYLMAIEKGHTHAMINLGDYYETHYNYELMKKYYLMGNKYKYIYIKDHIIQIYRNYKSFNYHNL